jgi:hypothetical protein
VAQLAFGVESGEKTAPKKKKAQKKKEGEKEKRVIKLKRGAPNWPLVVVWMNL